MYSFRCHWIICMVRYGVPDFSSQVQLYVVHRAYGQGPRLQGSSRETQQHYPSSLSGRIISHKAKNLHLLLHWLPKKKHRQTNCRNYFRSPIYRDAFRVCASAESISNVSSTSTPTLLERNLWILNSLGRVFALFWAEDLLFEQCGTAVLCKQWKQFCTVSRESPSFLSRLLD